ncbi:glycosyltransferase [Planctomicrobium piriforme]|uniref:Glycosyltransferase involved in cell wall bisynthesis n=1 Tax=Planctomicrobium piriforme TaxID=1576369 RepID=A0A1I3B9D2_9PLAN|nr:glycosyltransferase [Planctomicrobium piriforme]SFH58579.1 Glycosyltransferase involved in cell wall bisynthesis [Planctomicrobium piriforme]
MPVSPRSRPCIMQVMGTGNQYGGLEKHFFDLCNRLSADYEVVAVGHPDQAHGLKEGVHFESIGRHMGRRNPLTLFRMMNLIRRWKPDVIHAHANRAAEMVSHVKFCTRARCVATVHNIKQWHFAFRGFDQIIAVSRGVAASIPLKNVTVVYNGIRPPAAAETHQRSFLASQFQLSADKPIALSIGRLAHEKGYDVLIEAWKQIPAQLVIVGEGPERKKLESQIAAAGVSDRVRLAGFRKDVPALLASADMKIIASRREGFPYTLVEALMCRAVIVSTDVPGATEFVPAEYLAPREDMRALRNCILGTLSNLPAAKARYEPIWQTAARELTVETMVKNTVATYFPAARKVA